MPSRRHVLAASVPLLASTAGCLGGVADIVVSNELVRSVSAQITIERESDGSRALRQTVELAGAGEDGESETFPNPVTEDGVTYLVHVRVDDGPEGTGRFTDTGNKPFASGTSGLQAEIHLDEIEFKGYTS